MSNSKTSRPQINTMKIVLKIIPCSLSIHFVHALPILEQDVCWFFFNLEEDVASLSQEMDWHPPSVVVDLLSF